MTSESCLQSSYTLKMHAHRSLDATSLCASRAALALSVLAVRVSGKDVRLDARNLPGTAGLAGDDRRQDMGLIGRESREYRMLFLFDPMFRGFLPVELAPAPSPAVNFSYLCNVM